MLTYFSVEGYRNFATKLTWNFNDTRDYRFNSDALIKCGDSSFVKCALVYGRNAVGKTNLGNAIFDIRANFGMVDSVSDERNYVNADSETGLVSFEYRFFFDGHEVSYSYSKRGRRDIAWEQIAMDGSVVFDYDHDSSLMREDGLSAIGATTLNWAFLSDGMTVAQYVCNNTPMEALGAVGEMYRFVRNMGIISDAFGSDRRFVSTLVGRVIEAGKVSELEAFLHRFGIDEHLKVHQSPSGADVLYFEHRRPVAFAENCSSGTIALLRLFNYAMTIHESSLLFIDEFDAFYHHDLSEHVIEYLKELPRRQVICASHNTDLFSNKIMRPDCLFILSRSGITSAANATRRELREGHNLEKLYKAGEFDG